MGIVQSTKVSERPIVVPEQRRRPGPASHAIKARKPVDTMDLSKFTSIFHENLMKGGMGIDQIYNALLKVIMDIPREVKRAMFPTNESWISFLESQCTFCRISRQLSSDQVMTILNGRRVISSLVVTTRLIMKDIAAANGGDPGSIHVLTVSPFEPVSKATPLSRVSTHNDSCGSDGTGSGTVVGGRVRSALKQPGSQGGKRVRIDLSANSTLTFDAMPIPLADQRSYSYTNYSTYQVVSRDAGLIGPFRPVTDERLYERLSFGSI